MLTVALIEDEKQIRLFVRTALEAEGIAVFDAETGKQGLIETATRKPDLVIVDLGLPDTDGLDVIRELRGWSELPVIVLSARTREDEKAAALDAGADDYLTDQAVRRVGAARADPRASAPAQTIRRACASARSRWTWRCAWRCAAAHRCI
ncbi:MAG: KDP operon transcriptional regulatory protein KdpE [Burkholderia gladioli]|nr:MAG: KDP operon transcriptional regulatory protein KdpE [Burkholderia gladioli]